MIDLTFEIAETMGGYYVTVYVKGAVVCTVFRVTRSDVEAYITWRLKQWVKSAKAEG